MNKIVILTLVVLGVCGVAVALFMTAWVLGMRTV